jgi:hypothetical protein
MGDGKKVFFLPPGRGRSAGRRRAIEMRCGLRTATPSTLVLPAPQEQQPQATSAQTCKTCVCAAAVCFLVLLLPRSYSRPCNKAMAFFMVATRTQHLKKQKRKRSRSPQTPRRITTSLSQSSVAALPSADNLRPGPATAPLIASGSEDRHRGPYQQA